MNFPHIWMPILLTIATEYTPNMDEPLKGVAPVNLEITVSKQS